MRVAFDDCLDEFECLRDHIQVSVRELLHDAEHSFDCSFSNRLSFSFIDDTLQDTQAAHDHGIISGFQAFYDDSMR